MQARLGWASSGCSSSCCPVLPPLSVFCSTWRAVHQIPDRNGKVQVYLLNEDPESASSMSRNNGEQLNINTAQVTA